MTTHYEIREPDRATLIAEVDRITSQAVEEGRSYRLQVSHDAEAWTALITIAAKKAAE